MKETMIAMLLAGGKGTRLESLTKRMAKPAVYFGGKYRIIDFPLSNCANSGIDIVGDCGLFTSILICSRSGITISLSISSACAQALPHSSVAMSVSNVFLNILCGI